MRVSLLPGWAALLLAGGSNGPAVAADFNTQFRTKLQASCDDSPEGTNLASVCGEIRGDNGGRVGPVGSFSATGSSPDGARVRGLEERLQSLRQSKEEHIRNNNRGVYAAKELAQSDTLQLPLESRPTRDVAFGLGPGAGAFLSAGASFLSHHNNRFEDGYEAQLPTVTIGADYRINQWLAAGLAFNYTNYDGTYDDDGGFDRHIFGPLLYATVTPFQGAFANLVLGYARQENRNNRFAFATIDGGDPDERFGGHTSADYSANQYLASLVAGYDQPFGRVTVGPRLGLALSHEDFGSVKEEGDTGLELRYSNLDQTSVQSASAFRRLSASTPPTACLHRRLSQRGSMNMPTAAATSMLGWSRTRAPEASASTGSPRRGIGQALASALPGSSTTGCSPSSSSRQFRATDTS